MQHLPLYLSAMSTQRPQVPSRTPERICFAMCIFAVLSTFALIIAPGQEVSRASILALFALGSVVGSLALGAGAFLRARRRRAEAALQAYKEKLARAPIDW